MGAVLLGVLCSWLESAKLGSLIEPWMLLNGECINIQHSFREKMRFRFLGEKYHWHESSLRVWSNP